MSCDPYRQLHIELRMFFSWYLPTKRGITKKSRRVPPRLMGYKSFEMRWQIVMYSLPLMQTTLRNATSDDSERIADIFSRPAKGTSRTRRSRSRMRQFALGLEIN